MMEDLQNEYRMYRTPQVRLRHSRRFPLLQDLRKASLNDKIPILGCSHRRRVGALLTEVPPLLPT